MFLAADFRFVEPRQVMLASPKLRPLRRAAQVVKLLLAIYALRKVLQRLPELFRRYRATRQGSPGPPLSINIDQLDPSEQMWPMLNSFSHRSVVSIISPAVSSKFRGHLEAPNPRIFIRFPHLRGPFSAAEKLSSSGQPQGWPRPSRQRRSPLFSWWRHPFGGSEKWMCPGDFGCGGFREVGYTQKSSELWLGYTQSSSGLISRWDFRSFPEKKDPAMGVIPMKAPCGCPEKRREHGWMCMNESR